jgi:hypothetical protein
VTRSPTPRSDALQRPGNELRYKGLKPNATIVLVPASALQAMQLGGFAGITAPRRSCVPRLIRGDGDCRPLAAVMTAAGPFGVGPVA